MGAPACPISHSQSRWDLPTGVGLPSLPNATDLPSLIFTVNVIRNILIQITTSLTVNNTYGPPTKGGAILPPGGSASGGNNKGSKFYSTFPAWDQTRYDTLQGFVYHHEGQDVDKTQRSKIQRLKSVTFENHYNTNDTPFVWSFKLPLDGKA